MYYCLLRELVYHLNLNYTKFRLAFLEVSSLLLNNIAPIATTPLPDPLPEQIQSFTSGVMTTSLRDRGRQGKAKDWSYIGHDTFIGFKKRSAYVETVR